MKKAVFKLPHENQLIVTKNKEAAGIAASLFPFVEGEPLDIFSDIEYVDSLHDDFFDVRLSNLKAEINAPNKEEYIKKIEHAIEAVEENRWSKLVISRPIIHHYSSLNIKKTYLNLCEKYPNALCYLWVYEDMVWLGATPEILGKFNKKTKVFETMSLAGTLPAAEEWTPKEIEEQKPVTAYIYEILCRYSDEVKISDTYSHFSGSIKHLRNDFEALVNPADIDRLIYELHPTPAVCGIPKTQCQQKILEIEAYDRTYYSGYIKIETEDVVYYFVNLRCSQLFSNQCIIYAGGGVTAQSQPEKEWQETELKSHAILENLV